MIKLNSAEFLFDKQRVYTQTGTVNKTKMNYDYDDTLKAVLLYTDKADELPPAQQEMLEKMMAACKYKREEVQYINLHDNDIKLGDVLANSDLQLVLIFGKYEGASRNMVPLKVNVPIAVNGVEVLLTDSIEKLATEPKLKSNLWNALKVALGL